MPPTEDENRLINGVDENDNLSEVLALNPISENIADDDKAFLEKLEKASKMFPKKDSLQNLVQRASGMGDSAHVQELTLQTIGAQVGLQHLGYYTPNLLDLNLDGSCLGSLRELGSRLRLLKRLSVNRCGLISLDGLFGLQTLRELSLNDNLIRDLSACVSLPRIKIIHANRNKVHDISSLSLLQMCEELRCLDIAGNPFVEFCENYIEIISDAIPQLIVIDGDLIKDRNTSELQRLNSVDSNTVILPDISPKPDIRPSTSSEVTDKPTLKLPATVLSPRPATTRDTTSTLKLPKL